MILLTHNVDVYVLQTLGETITVQVPERHLGGSWDVQPSGLDRSTQGCNTGKRKPAIQKESITKQTAEH